MPVRGAREVRSAVVGFFAVMFPDRVLSDDEDMFALGFGNSLVALQLVTFLESEFQVAIEDDDLEMENFQSIAAVVALIGRKLDRSTPLASVS